MIKDIFLKYMLNILKDFIILRFIYYFYQKERKLKNTTSLFVICMTKLYDNVIKNHGLNHILICILNLEQKEQ